MHGVKRDAYFDVGEEKASKFIALAQAALRKRQERDFSGEDFTLINRILEVNPDEYSLWNFHKDFVLYKIENARKQYAGDTFYDKMSELFRSELDLTQRALYRHPKAYPAWQQRLFLLQKAKEHLSNSTYEQFMKQELEICAKLLDSDDRNFHGWAHRLRVRQIQAEERPSEEMSFVTERIYANFSNYSAWHHRSRILPILYYGREEEYLNAIYEEMELVKQAVFTEPEDQSAWFYYRWLLRGAPSFQRELYPDCMRKVRISEEIFNRELKSIEELLVLEPRCKWAMLMKVDLLLKLNRIDDAKALLSTIVSLDPLRKGYYLHLNDKLEKCIDSKVS
eukprot:jgi/Galph1/5973/GphlegSOOS_G4561.1